MEVLVVSEDFSVQSHKGSYPVFFNEQALTLLNNSKLDGYHFIIDRLVAELYQAELSNILQSPSVILIEALEENKSLHKFPEYIETLSKNGIKRNHKLIAIGGGIIEDITCFIGAILMRGIAWEYYPTTLLAQADSCIGSKSSINVGKIKNLVGILQNDLFGAVG